MSDQQLSTNPTTPLTPLDVPAWIQKSAIRTVRQVALLQAAGAPPWVLILSAVGEILVIVMLILALYVAAGLGERLYHWLTPPPMPAKPDRPRKTSRPGSQRTRGRDRQSG
jgi:hypothetical protein